MPWDLVGQEHAVDLLRRAVAAGRPSHAYLIVGPPQVGKRTLALTLARALECEGEDAPCGACRHCRRVDAGTHPDVFLIGLLAGEGRTRKEIGIDQMRDLQHQAHLQPYEGRYKVFLIDGADRLSVEAANAMLKTLEEPPAHVVLLLTAVAGMGLLPTVRSRCQRIELRPIPRREVEAALIERWARPPDEAARLARLAGGRLGWAVTACVDPGVLARQQERLGEVAGLLDRGRSERLAYAAELAGRFSGHRETVELELQLWLSWWRDLLLIKTGCANLTVHVEQQVVLLDQATRLSVVAIRTVLRGVWDALGHLRANVNPRLALDTLVLRLPEGLASP